MKNFHSLHIFWDLAVASCQLLHLLIFFLLFSKVSPAFLICSNPVEMIVKSLWSLWGFRAASSLLSLQIWAERVGMEGEGKEGGDERREGVVPAGPRRRLHPPGLLPLPIRRGVRGRGFILVGRSGCPDKKKPRKRVLFLFVMRRLFCSYEVQLESKVRRKGLGKFLIQILQLIANRWRPQPRFYTESLDSSPSFIKT